MADDPLVSLLKTAKLSDAQRAGLWDVFQVSADEDDLAERLKSLQLPAALKADLWDLKAQSAKPKTAEPAERRTAQLPRTVAVGMGPPRMPVMLEEGADPGVITNVVRVGERLANPQSATDFAALLTTLPAGPSIARSAASTAARGVQGVGRATEAAGNMLETAAAAKPLNVSTGGAVLGTLLSWDWQTALLTGTVAPMAAKIGGKVLQATGRAMQRVSIAERNSSAVTDRLARIPLAGRLERIREQLPDLPQVKPSVDTLSDDLTLVRESIAKPYSMPPDVALRIVAGKDKAYYDVLKSALIESIKTEGIPAPKPVTDLLKMPSFQRLPKP